MVEQELDLRAEVALQGLPVGAHRRLTRQVEHSRVAFDELPLVETELHRPHDQGLTDVRCIDLTCPVVPSWSKLPHGPSRGSAMLAMS